MLFGTNDFLRELSHNTVAEIQAGLEWSRQTRAGNAFARAFFESDSWWGDFDNSDETLGLIGFGLAVGLAR